jgi:putative membrane protein
LARADRVDSRFTGYDSGVVEMLWVKSLHIVFMVTWFAGLFYLPRLFVYHAMAEDEAGQERFKVMERKLYFGIMTPGGVLTLVFGIWLWLGYGLGGGWLHVKLALVAVLIGYHLWCGKLLHDFRHNRNTHSHVWYRWFNEVPVILLLAVVMLAVVKPF